MHPTLVRVTTLLASVAILSLAAAPAFAATEASPTEGNAGALVVGLILGVLVGLVIFIDAFTGGEPEPMPEPPREH